jgi:hypothetical protein
MHAIAPRSDEVTGEWRRLHKEELSDLYYSPHQYCAGDEIEKNEMDWACGAYE